MKINNKVGLNAVSGVSQTRSVFPRPIDIKTCGKASYVIPLYWDNVLPGDSVKCDIHGICRFIPNIHATMDNAYLDLYGFFVPNRLLWDHFEKFITMGNDPQAWTEETGLTVPQINFTDSDNHDAVTLSSLADYLGVPLNAGANGYTLSVSALPFRAYNKIINDWFVNLNIASPVFETTDDDSRDYDDNEYGLYQAFKLGDAMTLALPSSQRGPSVLLPLGQFAPISTETRAVMPVVGNGNGLGLSMKPNDTQLDFSLVGRIYEISGGQYRVAAGSHNNFGAVGDTAVADLFMPPNKIVGVASDYTKSGLQVDLANTSGVYADLSQATAATINQLRLAFQTQAFYELNARCGNNRYIEYLKSVFGVSNGDARLQRAEYLFGCRNLINVNEVTQLSSSTESSPMGEVAGKVANIINESNCFNKSFTEHGIIMYVMVIRNQNSYSQGLAKKFDQVTWLDFFNPIFDNIGEQPIKKKTLFLSNTDTDEETFGFQEAWYNYRYGESVATNLFRADAEQSLLSWTYGDLYQSSPSLSEEFLKSDYTNIERTLTLQGENVQFLANFLLDNVWTRPMKTHSIPGRIDHI